MQVTECMTIGRRLVVGGSALLLVVAAAPARGQPADAAAEAVPHRAIYQASLAPSSRGGPVEDVTGQLIFTWRDVCDGWASSQEYGLVLYYTEGSTVLASRYTTFESRDGTRFTFDTVDSRNGVVEDRLRGSAELDGSPGSGLATIRLPDTEEINLPAGTWFPTAFTLEVLDQARAGNRLFTALMFGGDVETPLTQVTAFISDPTAARNATDIALLDGPSWPITMAYFDPETRDSVPLYEFHVNLFPSGVIDGMSVSYGEFAIDFTLVSAEALPSEC